MNSLSLYHWISNSHADIEKTDQLSIALLPEIQQPYIFRKKTINSPSLYHWISNSHADIEKPFTYPSLYHWISNSHTDIEKNDQHSIFLSLDIQHPYIYRKD